MMVEIPSQVLYAAELAQARALAVAHVARAGGKLRSVRVFGIPRRTHLACVLRIAGFEPDGPEWLPVWVWEPPPGSDRTAN